MSSRRRRILRWTICDAIASFSIRNTVDGQRFTQFALLRGWFGGCRNLQIGYVAGDLIEEFDPVGSSCMLGQLVLWEGVEGRAPSRPLARPRARQSASSNHTCGLLNCPYEVWPTFKGAL